MHKRASLFLYNCLIINMYLGSLSSGKETGPADRGRSAHAIRNLNGGVPVCRMQLRCLASTLSPWRQAFH